MECSECYSGHAVGEPHDHDPELARRADEADRHRGYDHTVQGLMMLSEMLSTGGSPRGWARYFRHIGHINWTGVPK